jgi:hypothetical protein
MLDRRVELRLLCADVIEVQWKTNGRNHRCTAGLEDISPSGACLQLERSLPLLTTVRICHQGAELTGRVKYCSSRDSGYFLGVEFEPGCRWSEGSFHPRHLMNPRRLRS